MLIKIFGGTMLIASSVLFAERAISEDKRRIDQLEAYINIISYIKDRIDLYAVPLEKIFKDIDKDKLKVIGIDLPPKSCSDMLISDGLLIGDDARKTLSDFALSLGKGYRETQIKLCDQTILALMSQKKRALEELPSRKKTILALCLGVGGVTAIALI